MPKLESTFLCAEMASADWQAGHFNKEQHCTQS